MVVRRIRIERLEIRGVLYRSVFGGVEGAVRVQLDAQHIVNADRGNDRMKRVRVLRHHGSHQQAAIAAANGRELGGTRPVLVDEVARAGVEIIEYVLLVGQRAGRVPVLAIFAAAAQTGGGEHAVAVQPDPPARTEKGRNLADIVATIAVEKGG